MPVTDIRPLSTKERDARGAGPLPTDKEGALRAWHAAIPAQSSASAPAGGHALSEALRRCDAERCRQAIVDAETATAEATAELARLGEAL